MKGRAPTADEKRHMDAVGQIGCIVCLLYLAEQSPCSIHHVDGRTKKGAHFKVLGLCAKHHDAGERNDFYVSRHPWKAEFQRRYGTEEYLMEMTNKLIGDGNV